MKLNAWFAELIATFALTFFGAGAIASSLLANGSSGLVGIALAHGLALGVMVTATAAISGGHVNPAITIGLWVARKIDTPNAVGYVLFQCLGAILAAVLLKFTFPAEILSAVKMGTPALGVGVTVSMGLIMEIILTFFLMFAVYATAVDSRAPKVGGLFVGLTLVFAILAGGPISGAALNPARHLGPALLGGGLENLWLYWVGPVLGAIFAAALYHRYFEQK